MSCRLPGGSRPWNKRSLWPIAPRLGLPWWLAAVGYGVGLWVFALGVMAGLVAGFPLFLGFIPLAWASLLGHVLLAVAAAGAMRAAG